MLVNVNNVSFEKFKRFCRYCLTGITDGVAKATCRHPDNKPQGCSWGECNTDECPFLKD